MGPLVKLLASSKFRDVEGVDQLARSPQWQTRADGIDLDLGQEHSAAFSCHYCSLTAEWSALSDGNNEMVVGMAFQVSKLSLSLFQHITTPCDAPRSHQTF